MFRARRSSSFVFPVLAAAAVLSVAGQAFADRGNDHGGSRGHDRGNDHRDNGRDRGGRTNVSVGVVTSNRGSAFSLGIGVNSRPRWNDNRFSFGYSNYCAPVCPPVYVAPCPPVIVRRDYCDDYSWRRPIVIERPVYVQQPIVISQPQVVQQPVIVEKPVYVERPVYVQTTPVAAAEPQQQQNDQVGRYQDRELGDAYLRVGDTENAARSYARYLSVWSGDGTALRNYGFAQIAQGQSQEGFRNVVQGYRQEADLIKRPLRAADLGGQWGFQRLLDSASRAADGQNTPEAWLSVAILQDVIGQRELANNALQRARTAGLEQKLLDSFTLYLSRQQS